MTYMTAPKKPATYPDLSERLYGIRVPEEMQARVALNYDPGVTTSWVAVDDELQTEQLVFTNERRRINYIVLPTRDGRLRVLEYDPSTGSRVEYMGGGSDAQLMHYWVLPFMDAIKAPFQWVRKAAASAKPVQLQIRIETGTPRFPSRPRNTRRSRPTRDE